MLSLFIKGFIIGFSIAAPVGPIGILCINRTLAHGLIVGLVSGLGAAIADAIYGCIAGFGLVSISQFLLQQQIFIRIAGAAILAYLGIKTFIASSEAKNTVDKARTLWQDFSSTLLLTLTNPATIISFIAIYASLGIVEPNAHYSEALIIVLGVFLGSLLWWTILSSGISVIRHKLSEKLLTWINRLSGMVLIGFACLAVISIFMKT